MTSDDAYNCPDCECCMIDADAGHDDEPGCPCWTGGDDD